MLKNYLKIICRNLFRQKSSSFINIIGLAIAIASCLFILLYIFDELKFDEFNKNEDRIYRLVFNNTKTGEVSSLMPAALFPIITNEIPDIEKGIRVSRWQKVSVAFKSNSFVEDVYFSDNDIFDVLTFPLEEGNPENALSEPFSVVVTPSVARKYFGNSDPVGKVLKLDNNYNLNVTGVLKEIPEHSSLRPSIIVSMNSMNTIDSRFLTDMREEGSYFYFLLNKNSQMGVIQKKLDKIFKDQYGNNTIIDDAGFALQPLNEVYLYPSNAKWEIVSHGNIKYIRSFSVIALLILIMAAFNYTNLLTVSVKIREKEFAVRKLLGANRKRMIAQFLIETCSYLFIALCVALVIVDIFMNQFNQLTGKTLYFASLFQWKIILSITLLLLITAISSIVYPSILAFTSDFLSRLKGSSYSSRFKPSRMQFGFRQIVIGLQFIITISLIAVVIIIFNQLNYMLNQDLGFNKEHLLSIQNPYDKDMYSRFEEFKNEVSQDPHVLSITAGANVPSNNFNNFTQVWVKGKKIGIGIHAAQIAIDYDYLKTLQAKLLLGRDFSQSFKTDADKSVIINQTLAKELELTNPVGAELSGINNASDPQQVIGVVEDMHFESFKEKIPPAIFYLRQWSAENILLRLKGDQIVTTMKYLETEWHKIIPSQPFIYSFLDQTYDNLYKSEKQTGTVILIFCIFGVVISCIGLFGLVSLFSQTRRKEIGIRKVLGATVANAMLLMTREYLIIIAAANIIAIPITYYLMNNWLRNFAYRIQINVYVFILSGVLALIIALLTLSLQVIRSATANPVESLRYE